MEYCQSNTDKSIAGVMAAVLAFKGSGWALLVGFAMNLLLSNMDFQKKKLGVLTTEELDQVEAKKDEEAQRLLVKAGIKKTSLSCWRRQENSIMKKMSET